MSRVYAIEEGSGRRFLARIECDGPGCSASIAPNPQIASSGWICAGNDSGLGTTKHERDYCPRCAWNGGLR